MQAPLLLTPGEPAGIGPDCVLRAWQHNPAQFDDICIVAPPAWITGRASDIGIAVEIERSDTPKTPSASGTLCCWNPVANPVPDVRPGIPTEAASPIVIGSIEAAAKACMDQRASGLVTGPIEKSVLKAAGFVFPGHTEFLANIAGVDRVVMMLASEALRIALLTTHMALKDVPDTLSIEETREIIRITHVDLRSKFGLTNPRIALCALNPHAGESGHFGREEIEILLPAAEQAQTDGIDISAPLAADSLFSPESRTQYDAIICCYHDQGLIPIKALSFGEAVNVTLGLPFIRTSVDHGTALSRAGGNDVRYSSLIAAITMARQMNQRRNA